MKHGIFCLEGMWEPDLVKRSTMQPMLELLKTNEGAPFAYRDVATREEFFFYLEEWIKPEYSRKLPVLYIAAEGGEARSLQLSSGTNVGLDEIQGFLKGHCGGRVVLLSAVISGLDQDLLQSFVRDTGAFLVGSYAGEDVDWTRSTAFDYLLLSSLQKSTFESEGISKIKEWIGSLQKSFEDQGYLAVFQDS